MSIMQYIEDAQSPIQCRVHDLATDKPVYEGRIDGIPEEYHGCDAGGFDIIENGVLLLQIDSESY